MDADPDRSRFVHPSDLWTWRGRVGRFKYAGLGIFFFAVKHTIDRFVAASFGYRWTILDYWVYTDNGVEKISHTRAEFYATLILVALPFIWIGVILTLRRLRDTGLPLWCVMLFFVPFINLLFFLVLSIYPSASKEKSELSESGFRQAFSRIIPTSEFGSAAMGVLITTALAVVFTLISVNVLSQYGWGLFVGIPFFLGLNSVLIYGYHERRPYLKCLGVALLSVLFVGAALFVIAFEGLVCIVMAAPLAIVLAALGGSIGFEFQRHYSFQAESFQMLSLLVIAIPALILIENLTALQTPTFSVRTAVVIDAPPEKVWTNLIAFAELPPPKELLFRTGVAYPIRAKIDGTGVRAVRHCVFSTGEFVEPIRVWDEPRLLKFDVRSQPRTMDELSVYKALRPQHLENFLVSRQGQFALTQLSDGRTLLEGTTWYENRFWPAQYWRLWSDFIIHRIHSRVLLHIKNLSEDKSVLAP